MKMEKRNLTCIGCPMGCALLVEMDGKEIISVTGNTCKKGAEYAVKEVTDPTRIVTTTVRVKNGSMPVVSVKTAQDIPKGKIFGVSKLARIVDMFARRLQIQERLSNQIARTIYETIQPEGVGVVMEAQHLCMLMRGVQKQNSTMVTSAMFGSFRSQQSTRMEFLKLIKN